MHRSLNTTYRLFRLFLLGWTILLAPLSAHAQSIQIRDYHVFCNPDDLELIHDNPHEDIYIPCEFQYDGDVWHDVRLRLRGDSSRDYPKKSYKINFDKDERFGERDKINLNSEWLDKTFAKEFLSYSAFANVGLPSSRCWYARLYINGEYFGLYLDVEQVDDISLDRMDFPEGATLYKAARDRAMLNFGEPVEELWEKETNTETGFYDLNALIEWVDQEPASSFYAQLGQRFDRPLLARHMALNAIICNSSTYYHNYYLVHDLSPEGRWSILPWDMDRSNYPWDAFYHQPQYYLTSSPALEEINPFIVRCWQDDQMRDDIFAQMAGMIDSSMTRGWYQEIVDHLDTLLVDAIEADPNKQFTVADFHNSIRTIPQRIEARGQYLLRANEEIPLPFDLYPSFVRNDSLILSWQPSAIGDGSTVTYRVEVDTIKVFSTSQSFDAGTDTSLTIGGLPPGLWYWNVYAEVDGWPETRSFRFFRTLTLPSSRTRIDQSINSSTILASSGSPYTISGDIQIAENAAVTVEPGVAILLEEGASLTVSGSLNLAGSVTDSVHLGMIGLSSNTGNQLHVSGQNAVLNMSHVSVSPGVTISLADGGHLSISSSTIRSSQSFVSSMDGSLEIDSTDFQASGSNLFHLQSSSARFAAVSASLKGEDSGFLWFEGTDSNSLTLVDCDISQFEGSGIQLRGGAPDIYVDRLFLRGTQGTNGLSIDLETDSLRFWNVLIEGYSTALELSDGPTKLNFRNGLLVHNSKGLVANPAFSGTVEIKNVVFWNNQTDWEIADSSLNLGWSFVPEDSLERGNSLVTGDDPGFVDGWNGYYYPAGDSPLIDAGYGNDIPLLDGASRPRLDVGTTFNRGVGTLTYVDIGLYENQAGFVPPPVTPPPIPGAGKPLFGYPNPFNSTVRILYDVDQTSDVVVTIYNILGQEVYHTAWQNRTAGRYYLYWNGLTASGNELASGLYFVQVRQAGTERTMRLVLVR